MTAHNTALKFHFTMSKFYHSSERIAFLRPQIKQYPWSMSLVHQFENSPLSDRDCLNKTTLARIWAAHLFNANCYLVRVRLAFPRRKFLTYKRLCLKATLLARVVGPIFDPFCISFINFLPDETTLLLYWSQD